MSAWRRCVALLVVVLFALAALGAPAHAQLGNVLKKAIPKPASPAAPPPPVRKLYGEGITPELVDRFLKALAARAVGFERAQAAERARKATEDRINQGQALRLADAMQKQGDCEDAAKEKDPRYKEAIRLNELSNAANDKGDQKAGDKYGEQAAALNDALDDMAKRVCTGDCAAKTIAKDPRNKEVAEKEQAAAQAKNPDVRAQLQAEAVMLRGIIQIEAEMSCGAMGASKPSAEEEAASAAAAEAAKNAKDSIDKDALAAGELTAEEFARLIEIALGVLSNNASTPVTPESKAALEGRSADLRPALKKAGVL